MERKEILETLKRFGLSDYESRAYMSLTLLGPTRASEISKESCVPQSKIYDTLDQLMSKQLIEVFEGRPKEFKAVEPKVAFRTLLEGRKKELEDLRDRATTISGLLKPARDEIIEGVWTQKSKKRSEVLNRLSSMLDRCKKYAYDVTRDFSYSSRYRKSVKACIRKGVAFKVIGIGSLNEENYHKVKWFYANGIPVKFFETNVHPRILVVDGREVSIRLDHDPLKHSFTFHSIWSEDPSLVKVFDSYMKNLWINAKPVDRKALAQCFV